MNREEIERYMLEAIEQAKIAKQINDIPIGAVVVKDGKIIGRGHNNRVVDKMTTSHAEIMAINEACKTLGSWKLDDCAIFVTVEPCLMCAGAIIQARIKDVFFGTFDEKGGAFGSVSDLSVIQGLNHYPIIHTKVLEQQCRTLVTDFFVNMRLKKEK